MQLKTKVKFWDDEGQVFFYKIPNLWLAGRVTSYTHIDKVSLEDAYYYACRDWHEQAVLAKQYEKEAACVAA